MRQRHPYPSLRERQLRAASRAQKRDDRIFAVSLAFGIMYFLFCLAVIAVVVFIGLHYAAKYW